VNIKAAGELNKTSLTESDMNRVMKKFLKDNDPFLVKNGHALRYLPDRLAAYQNGKLSRSF
jgi:hypothetical protein